MPALGGGSGAINRTTSGTVTHNAPTPVYNKPNALQQFRTNPLARPGGPQLSSTGVPRKIASTTRTASAGTTAPVHKSAPAPAPSPVSRMSFTPSGGGGSLGEDTSGGGVGGGGGNGSTVAAAPPIPTDDEFLAGDGAFQSQLDSLLKALTNYGSSIEKQRADYDTDFQTGLKGLGWRDKDNDLGNNVVKNAQGGYDAAADAGDWDWSDQNGAAGRGFTAQQNDFASRGLLQSTDYVKSQDDFKRSLMDQLNQTVSGRARYQQGLTDQYAAYKDDAGIDEKRNLLGTGQAQQARFDALARKASQFGTTAT